MGFMPSSDNIAKLAEMVADVLAGKPQYATSLTRYSKTTSVVARTYIEDTLLGEDICIPLMGTLNQIYISYVLTALQLNNVIANYSIIRSAIAKVSTEGIGDSAEMIEQYFKKPVKPSMESKLIELDKTVAHLAAGKVIEFDFIVGHDEKNKPIMVTVPIHITMLPAAITPSVATAFLSLNFLPSFDQRMLQWKAGEISLFKDLIFSKDIIEKTMKAMKEDTTNVLHEMISAKSRSRIRQFLSLLAGKPANNVASSVLVFNKRTFDMAAHEANLNFSRFSDRQRFFDAALAMLVAVVDPMYDSVDIYYNGLQQYSTITSRMLEGASKGDGINMKDLMASIAKGAPKF